MFIWNKISSLKCEIIWSLTHFSPTFNFYTPWKRQKTFVFFTFSGSVEMEN